MPLIDKVNEDIKAAMLAKEADRLTALRAIKSALLLLQTSGNDVTDEGEMKELQKLHKQRKEAADIYQQNGRDEQAKEELDQAAVIEQYLPEQMSEEELKGVLKEIIESLGASSMADMGKVMGAASQQLAGKADNKLVSQLVRELLN